MKLYAKTTSERASKGQGGNEYLIIRITNDKKEVIAELDIQTDKDKFMTRFWRDEHKTYEINQ